MGIVSRVFLRITTIAKSHYINKFPFFSKNYVIAHQVLSQSSYSSFAVSFLPTSFSFLHVPFHFLSLIIDSMTIFSCFSSLEISAWLRPHLTQSKFAIKKILRNQPLFLTCPCHGNCTSET